MPRCLALLSRLRFFCELEPDRAERSDAERSLVERSVDDHPPPLSRCCQSLPCCRCTFPDLSA